MRTSISKSKDVVSESTGGGKFINSSGIYDITIDFASVAVSSGGAESVNFNITYNGNTQTLWGPYVTDKEGNDLDIGNNLILRLGVIAGMEDGEELILEDQIHKVGKDNKEQEFTVIDNFTGLDCKVHVQEEYSMYNNEIKDRLVIKAFFREDGASAQEITEESEIGKQLELVKEKYANNITYRDNLTPEDVAAWKEERSNNAKGNKAATKGTVASVKKRAVFRKK